METPPILGNSEAGSERGEGQRGNRKLHPGPSWPGPLPNGVMSEVTAYKEWGQTGETPHPWEEKKRQPIPRSQPHTPRVPNPVLPLFTSKVPGTGDARFGVFGHIDTQTHRQADAQGSGPSYGPCPLLSHHPGLSAHPNPPGFSPFLSLGSAQHRGTQESTLRPSASKRGRKAVGGD